MGMLEPSVNARIQDMRIVTKVSLSEEESEFDGKNLNKEQSLALLEYHKTCPEPRRKEFLEIFFFAFHACGLRVVDVMTLQWGHINFEKEELRNIIYTTNTVEGYHRQLRKVTKNKGVFTSDTALEKLVYLAFTRI
jgi:integrase